MKNDLLLIDDEPISNFITESYARNFFPDVGVVSFNSAEQALEQLEQQRDQPGLHPRFILLDLNMPVMNGWDFLQQYEERRLAGCYRDTIIYIVSSSIHPEDLTRAEQSSVVKGFITKPVDEKKLEYIFREKAVATLQP